MLDAGEVDLNDKIEDGCNQTIISILSNVATLFWETIQRLRRSFSDWFVFRLWTECKHSGSIRSSAAPHESLLMFTHGTV